MVQSHTQDHDFNQTNPSSRNNKAQQHDNKENVPEYRLKVAANCGLYAALASLLLVDIFSYFNLSAVCFSDTAKINKEINFGKDVEALTNLLCPVLNLINHHVNMSKMVPLIEFFSFLVIIWAVAVLLLLGAKFNVIHVVMFLIWSILMLRDSDTYLTLGIDLIILGLLFIWSSQKKQQPNGGEKLQPKREEPKSCFEMYP